MLAPPTRHAATWTGVRLDCGDTATPRGASARASAAAGSARAPCTVHGTRVARSLRREGAALTSCAVNPTNARRAARRLHSLARAGARLCFLRRGSLFAAVFLFFGFCPSQLTRLPRRNGPSPARALAAMRGGAGRRCVASFRAGAGAVSACWLAAGQRRVLCRARVRRLRCRRGAARRRRRQFHRRLQQRWRKRRVLQRVIFPP